MSKHCSKGSFRSESRRWSYRWTIWSKGLNTGLPPKKRSRRSHCPWVKIVQEHSHQSSSLKIIVPDDMALSSSQRGIFHSWRHRFHARYHKFSFSGLRCQRDDRRMVGSDDCRTFVHWGEKSSSGKSGSHGVEEHWKLFSFFCWKMSNCLYGRICGVTLGQT